MGRRCRQTPEELVNEGRAVVRAEAQALEKVAARLGPPFAEAVQLVTGCRGRVATSVYMSAM